MTVSLSHRITAISMALLLLLSSTGFSMDVHYCQDQIKSVSLFGTAKSCHDKQGTPPCHKAKKACHPKEDDISNTDKDNCCHNETVIIEKSEWDATATPLSTLQDIQLEFITAFACVYVFNYPIQADYPSFTQYKPPLPDRDVQVLYQSFLI